MMEKEQIKKTTYQLLYDIAKYFGKSVDVI